MSSSKYRPGRLDFIRKSDFLFDPSSESPAARREEDEDMRPVQQKPLIQSKPTLSSLFFKDERPEPKLLQPTTL